MDYGSAFVYMFSGEGWVKKFVLGIAMSLTPALGPIVLMGWSLDVLRNLNQDEPDPLPEWTGDDFARWLGRGLGLSVALLTYLLPVIVIAVILWGCSALSLAALGEDSEGAATAFSVCLCCIFFILYFIIGLGALVVYVRYAATDQLDVGLEYAKTFQLVSANIAPLLIIVLLTLILGMASAILGILTIGVFFFILPPYYVLVMAYFGAQLSREPGFIDLEPTEQA
jgi:hypothetical protein